MSLEALEYIAANMREVDRLEIFGLRWDDDASKLARDTAAAIAWGGKARIFYHASRPAAVVGVFPRHPGVWYAFAYGTDSWRHVFRQASRYAVTEVKPWLIRKGARRMEVQSRVDHVEAHKWLAKLGAKVESVLSSYGRDGTDYYNFVWLREG